jgi:hypothetical protein
VSHQRSDRVSRVSLRVVDFCNWRRVLSLPADSGGARPQRRWKPPLSPRLIGLDERTLFALAVPFRREGWRRACSQKDLMGFPFSGHFHWFEKLHVTR